jgi:hypothetical protein
VFFDVEKKKKMRSVAAPPYSSFSSISFVSGLLSSFLCASRRLLGS